MKNFFVHCLLLLTAHCIPAQPVQQKSQQPSAPKLIVGIIVDQMRYDYIYKYWNKYGNDGFKRLVSEGFFCKNANYNYVPTYTGPGHASVYTGTTPSVHGIIANSWIDRLSDKEIYCSWDDKENGVGTTTERGKMSPRNLLTTTVCDELRIGTNKKAKVIGIAIKDRGAILPAGHTANAAYWFDGNSSWISSTYYMKELPGWVAEFNKKENVKKYLAQPWSTLLPIEQYTESSGDDNAWELPFQGEAKPVFPHNLPEIMKTSGPGLIATTPFGNSLTKDFAIEAIKNENLGKENAADFLAVSFSSTDYIGHRFGPQSVEVEDCYLRLDKDLAELLKFIDAWAGKNNALVFLTADHGASDAPGYLAENRIPSGTIFEKTVSDSLKKLALRTFGDSAGVVRFANSQVYLNKNYIQKKNLSYEDLCWKFGSYALYLPGVADMLTASQLQSSSFTDPVKNKIQNGYNRQRSGDVVLVLQPGWVEDYKTGTTHGSAYSYDTHVPLLFWGWNIKPGSSAEAVNITDIAPTLSLMLNIQYPSGCTGKPIPFLAK